MSLTTRRLRFAFVMDQQVGLKTQALNFEHVLKEEYPDIEAVFIPVHYTAQAANPLVRAVEHYLPASLRGTLAGVREIREQFAQNAPFDAVLWATWAAKSVLECVRSAPSFLIMDMTPNQMEELGERYGYTKSRAQFMGAWKRHATQELYQTASHLFPWNHWVGTSLHNNWGVPDKKITVLSPGTDVKRFHPKPESKPNDGITRLLFVGGDFERKGGDLLLRYIQERDAQKPPIELHCVTRDTIPNAPANVHVHKNIANNSPELVRLYQLCDLFVLPTRADCYSLVALEAMASGLPVVITDMGGIGDIVRDRETGYLLSQKEDYATLASILDEMISNKDDREIMGDAAHERAIMHFDCRKTVRQVITALQKSAEASRSAPKVESSSQ